MNVHEFMGALALENQEMFKKMLAKAGVFDNPSLDDAIPALTTKDALSKFSPTEKEIIVMMMKHQSSRFEAKLSFDQRCQILALKSIGITREQLAIMFGINRRTVTHIYNPQSPHYKNVRDRVRELGEAEFQKMYLPQSVLDRALIFQSEREAAPEKSNPHANRKAGAHQVRGEYCERPHRVVIAWKEDGEDGVETAGWYYNDLDGSFPNEWLSANDKSRVTSDACYRSMLKELSDPVSTS